MVFGHKKRRFHAAFLLFEIAFFQLALGIEHPQSVEASLFCVFRRLCKTEQQTVNMVSVGGEDNFAAQFLPPPQQERRGIKLLPITTGYTAGVDLQRANLSDGALQRSQRGNAVAGMAFVKEPSVTVELFDQIKMALWGPVT